MIASARGRWSPPAGCLLLALLAAPAPLTNEDIVRLVNHGTPEKTILHEIEVRPVDFDLSPGVVEELRRVGVSAGLIEAMRRRQAAMPRPAAAAPPGAPTAPDEAAPQTSVATSPAGRLSLRFDLPAGGDAPSDPILAIASLPKGAPRPRDAEIGTVTDLALAILCTSTEHVPDHWDTRTPLKDAPRHEMILFRPGGSPGHLKGFDVIFLSRDPVDPIPIDPGSHALVVALAGKQSGSGTWRLLATDTIRVQVEPGVTAQLVLDARSKLTGSRMTGFHFEQVFSVRQDSTLAPAGTAP